MRTWILFIVGIGLVGLFAWQRNPLNPWWTLIIGAFTCSAIIVSAVQALVGGLSDAARAALEEERKNRSGGDADQPPSQTLSIDLGSRSFSFIRPLRLRNPTPI